MRETTKDFGPPVEVTRANAETTLAGLPFFVRRALNYALDIRKGEATVVLPGGKSFLFRGDLPGPSGTLIVRDYSFARRLANGGDIGFAEAYIRGEWDSPDVTAFLEVFSANHESISSLLTGNPIGRMWQNFRHWLNRNTKAGSRRNIHAHYDLGNAFYSQWLDGTMTYSSALFDPHDEDLSTAQTRKYRALAEKTRIGPNDHVLEIGCGWGGFAEFTAREIGAKVTGLTISTEQYDYARKRIFEAGLNEKVEIKLQDYRDETGLFDRVASIEMFEAVGKEFWGTYFGQLRERLKPGGAAGVQVITIKEQIFENYVREQDFIRRYIFPGGMLPTPTIMKELGEKVGMPLVHDRVFGHDYARTVAEWRDRFLKAWPSLAPLGFDERFKRIWQYYLHYCEAGFRTGLIDVRQMVFARND
jgi:cyclopropane-fatty-acyl-phospholipid synthase